MAVSAPIRIRVQRAPKIRIRTVPRLIPTDGKDGEDGPSNVLSIGTVEGGDTASATLSGTSPAQVLNLVLPKGDPGIVQSLVAGTNVTIDSADPANPVISSTGGASSDETLDYYSTLALEQAEDRATGPVFAGPSGNGIFDGFNVLTYVDTANAVNLDTSTAGELRVASTYVTAKNALGKNQAGYVNHAHRIRIASSQLQTDGTKIRLTLKGVSTGTAAAVSSMYVGERAATGDVYDFSGNQVQVTVGGSGSFTIDPATTVVTDWITLAIDSTKDLVISFFTASGDLNVPDTIAGQTTENFDWWIKSGATDESSVSDVTGYTQSVSYDVAALSQIEIEGAGNLIVASSAMTLSEQPDWARLYAIVAPDTAAMGVDLQFAVARGVGYVNVTMNLLYTRPDGTSVYGSGNTDLTAMAAGTTGRWRIKTLNGVTPRILALGLMFGVN